MEEKPNDACFKHPEVKGCITDPELTKKHMETVDELAKIDNSIHDLIKKHRESSESLFMLKMKRDRFKRDIDQICSKWVCNAIEKNDNSPFTCTICYTNMRCHVLPCGHFFCFKCIAKIMGCSCIYCIQEDNSGNCPVCKQSFKDKNIITLRF